MADIILILGESGSGKSTAQETLNPESTFILNVTGKPLPFRGWKSRYNKEKRNYHVTHNYAEIVKSLEALNDSTKFGHIKTIVIDDFQYVMSFEFMNRAKEVGYNKFTEMAQHVFKVIDVARQLRDDLTVIFLCHSTTEKDDSGNRFTKIKTIGKMLDEKITLEGLFTIVLVADVEPPSKGETASKHVFITQNDGSSTAKSPKGMFSELKIPNDLALVLSAVEEYNA